MQEPGTSEPQSEQTPEELPAVSESSAEQPAEAEHDADGPVATAAQDAAPIQAGGDGQGGGEGGVGQTDDGPSGAGGDKQWYVLKVQSGREDRIREGLERRVAIEGLQDFFGEIIVPTERVSEIKGGKKRVSERKLYPGYIMINMEINDDTWFLVRETPGIGDFTGGAGKPVAMEQHEVERMLGRETSKQEGQPRLKIDFQPGEQVKVKEGTFENFEGSVDSVDEASGRVTVMINIFGRSTPVELEYWQVEAV
jgi:transcriptional antiterminator NusG